MVVEPDEEKRKLRIQFQKELQNIFTCIVAASDLRPCVFSHLQCVAVTECLVLELFPHTQVFFSDLRKQVIVGWL